MVEPKTGKPARKGARRQSDIDPETRAELNAGRIASATLAECLVVDHAKLLRTVAPQLSANDFAAIGALSQAGITQRMAAVADLLRARLGHASVARFSDHTSDTVRGWAAFMVGRMPGLDLADRLTRMRGFADDPHFGVREWAWVAVRPSIVGDVETAISLLSPWTQESSANLRRFAVEATRPRGVWAAHIPDLKRDPSIGAALLEPLRADDVAYVQDSVGNWLNDAAKDQPDWVRALCDRWCAESPQPATLRICRRATRSLP